MGTIYKTAMNKYLSNFHITFTNFERVDNNLRFLMSFSSAKPVACLICLNIVVSVK